MASTYVGISEETEQHQIVSPRNLRRTHSSNSSTNNSCIQEGPSRKCVCAPATHAGSFKCRLHRVNSQNSSSAQLPPVSNSPTHTVEAV